MAGSKDLGFDFSTFDDIINGIDSSAKNSKARQNGNPDNTTAAINRFGIDDGLMQEIYSLTDNNMKNNNVIGKGGDKAKLKPTDAEVVISVMNNGLEATICVYSPQLGGKDVTMEDIQAVLTAKKIVYGIDEEMLENIVKEGMYDSVFTFAHGDPPKNGVDGVVKPRYDEVRKYQPKLREDGSVDYRDLGMVVNIKLGDPICDITHETAGTPGMDIYGNTLLPLPGRAPVIPSGQNTGLNGDKSMLIALASGNLIFQNGKFAVETTVVIKNNVDISTGNINFLGNVEVKGNVDEGFTVISEKDIIVSGMINGATLQATGNIIVKNGVVNSTLISTEGNITIGFGENSKIKCKGNLRANSLVSSHADVEGSLECVSNPGTIVGGSYSVMGNLSCNTLGHRNYIATSVMVGNFALLMQERQELENRSKKLDEDIDKLDVALKFINGEKAKGVRLSREKEEFASAAVRLKVQKTLEKKPLAKRITEIDSITGSSEKLIIKINRFLHPNVKISLGKFTMQTTEEYGKSTIYETKNGIVIS